MADPIHGRRRSEAELATRAGTLMARKKKLCRRMQGAYFSRSQWVSIKKFQDRLLTISVLGLNHGCGRRSAEAAQAACPLSAGCKRSLNRKTTWHGTLRPNSTSAEMVSHGRELDGPEPLCRNRIGCLLCGFIRRMP